MQKTYVAIDLKSYYASVECADRNFDPLTTNLVVADESRTEKTICLAVSPSLKACGIPGRARLFEVLQRVREVNAERFRKARALGLLQKGEDGKLCFSGSSFSAAELEADPSLELAFITAPPRMKMYEEVSTRIFSIYMRYVSPEDIHVYSIDECFIDVTGYLKTLGMTAREMAMKMIREVLYETRITATAGIGTNLYLAKIAMDIVAKHVPADRDGVRIAELDEWLYRKLLWCHRPLTDFWRVGGGISRRLEKHGCFTMGDVARRSVKNEEELYREFGIDAELLIDHAWGWESCTMADIKAYRPESKSISVGQVLPCPYDHEKGRLIVHEMADQLALDLFAREMTADSVTLCVCFDTVQEGYRGDMERDFYGRMAPKPVSATLCLTDAGGARQHTSSGKKIIAAALRIYDAAVPPNLYVRRFYVILNNVLPREQAEKSARQLDFFTDPAALAREAAEREKEARVQRAMVEIKDRFGKNAILKGISYAEGATARERNGQIGGHAAGSAG